MSDDPCEKPIAEALTFAKIDFLSGTGRNKAPDFELGGIAIECKQFYSPRAVEQMSRYNNAILLQGRGAALWFADVVRGSGVAISEAEKRGYERGTEEAALLVQTHEYTSSNRTPHRSLVPSPKAYQDQHHATIALAIRALKEKA